MRPFLATSLGSTLLIGLWIILASGLIAQSSPLVIRAPNQAAVSRLHLNLTRQSPLDLEIGGEIAGLPENSTRYITAADLLALPQVSYSISDDPNFTDTANITGIPLEELSRLLAVAPATVLIVAICDDKYQANYPRAYIAAHHPVLVLNVNGQLASQWPKDPETHTHSMGPYMVSHPRFLPSFRIFAHNDEAQIPWGVVRLDFRNEKRVLGAIAPRGPHASDALVQAGYRIAQQNCYRCHNMGKNGGQKAERPWLVLSAWSSAAPTYFTAYVRNPKQRNEHAEMSGNPNYDNLTIRALIAYFQTFTLPEVP